MSDRRKPVLIIEFDGVIYDYDKYGWKGIDELEGLPLEGAKEAIEDLSKVYKIYVYSNRCSQPRGKKAVKNYLEKHQIDVEDVVLNPPPYYVFIGTKLKEFPRRWKDDYINELKEIAPREG